MGGRKWMVCNICQAQTTITIASSDPPNAFVGIDPYYHPAIAIYARPPGKKGMVRVGWLLRCGHVIIENNLAGGLS